MTKSHILPSFLLTQLCVLSLCTQDLLSVQRVFHRAVLASSPGPPPGSGGAGRRQKPRTMSGPTAAPSEGVDPAPPQVPRPYLCSLSRNPTSLKSLLHLFCPRCGSYGNSIKAWTAITLVYVALGARAGSKHSTDTDSLGPCHHPVILRGQGYYYTHFTDEAQRGQEATTEASVEWALPTNPVCVSHSSAI